MKKILMFALVASLSAAFLSSCKKDDASTDNTNNNNNNNNNTGTDNLSWMKTNNRWRYDLTFVGGLSGTGKDTTFKSGYVTMISKDLTGGKYEVTDSINIFGGQVSMAYWMNDANTTFYTASKSDFSDKVIQYKANAKVGDVFGPDSSYNEVVSISEAVSTPAGNFTCIKIKNTDKRVTPAKINGMNYISKTYGMIKSEGYGTNGAVSNSLILTYKNF